MQLQLAPMRIMFAALNIISPTLSAKMAQRLYTMPPRKAKPLNAVEQDFFNRAELLTIPYPSHPLRAWRAGRAGAKTVLLVHGWGGVPAMWVPLANQLLARDFQVICYEAPGHGQHPEPFTSPMGFADSVRAMLQAIGPVHAVVGHSIGAGAVVMASKLGVDAQRLVLLSPLTRVADHTHSFAAQLGISAKAIALMRQRVWDYAEPSSSAYGKDWDEVYTAREAYQTLIVHDTRDRFMPIANTEWLMQRWPRATLIKTEGVSHGRTAKDTATIRAVCDFLGEPAQQTAAPFALAPPARARARRHKRSAVNMTWVDPARLHSRIAGFKSGWPASSREGIRFHDLSRSVIRARTTGRAGTGLPTLVLVCDPPNVIEHFDELINLLAPHARVVCFEPAGFGFSTPLKAFDFSFEHYQASIDELLVSVNEGPYLLALPCVWSHLALQIAAAKPELVSRLMLWQSPEWEQQVKWARYVDANKVLATPGVGQLATAFAARSIGIGWHRASMAKGRYPEFTAPLDQALQHGSFCCLASLWQRFYDHAPPPVQVQQPALITWGTLDRTHRASDKLSLSSQLPNAVWHDFFQDAGHSPEIEVSAKFAHVLLDWARQGAVQAPVLKAA